MSTSYEDQARAFYHKLGFEPHTDDVAELAAEFRRVAAEARREALTECLDLAHSHGAVYRGPERAIAAALDRAATNATPEEPADGRKGRVR